MFGNHGIDVRGFGGDTMHMARLWSAARIRGYSLEALSKDLTSCSKVTHHRLASCHWVLLLCCADLVLIECFFLSPPVWVANSDELQIPMKQRFGRNRLRKDGTPGKIVELPPIVELHSSVRVSSQRLFVSHHSSSALHTSHSLSLSLSYVYVYLLHILRPHRRPNPPLRYARVVNGLITARWTPRPRGCCASGCRRSSPRCHGMISITFVLLLCFIIFFQLIFPPTINNPQIKEATRQKSRQ